MHIIQHHSSKKPLIIINIIVDTLSYINVELSLKTETEIIGCHPRFVLNLDAKE